MFDPVLTGNEVTGSYDLSLVILSYVIAVLASFTALDLAVRINKSSGVTQRIWIAGCSFSMGSGIWVMHFTGMLAFKLPLTVSYDIWITLLSMIIAVLASGISFFYATAKPILISRIAIGGLIMGIGVATMHYTGMAAMEFMGSMYYKSGLFVLSVIIAIFSAFAALWLIIYFGKDGRVIKVPYKIVGALVMGMAVCGMHYTGMAATIIVPQGTIFSEVQSTTDARLFAFSISGVTLFLLAFTVIASITQEEFSRLKGINELILHSAGDGIYGLDLNGYTTFSNPAAEKMLGYSLKEMRGKSQHALIHHSRPDGTPYPREKCLIHAAIKDGTIQHVSNEVFWRKDGSSFHVEYTSNPILDDGTIKGAVVSFKDITDRIKAEKIITRFGRILDNSSNEIYVFDASTFFFIQVNFGARNNLGYSTEELTHLTPVDLKPEYTKEIFEELIRPLREKQEPMVVFETLHKRKDGTLYPVSVHLQLMHDESNPVFVAIIEDITQRKKDKENLKIYADQLKKSNTELEHFAAIASHDLMEPLRKIVTFGDRLLEKAVHLDEQSRNYVERMQKSTIRMKCFIEDLLHYSRVTSRTKSFEQIDLNNIIKESLHNLEDRLDSTKGKINVDNLPNIEADPFQLRQLFQNLIGNALKYHKEGISPVVNIQSQHSGNGGIKIIIEDNGIGFDEKYAERIFQPFQRLHGKDEYEGTGFGLAICMRIVACHNGSMNVKSALGEGSSFFITLPEKQNKET